MVRCHFERSRESGKDLEGEGIGDLGFRNSTVRCHFEPACRQTGVKRSVTYRESGK